MVIFWLHGSCYTSVEVRLRSVVVRIRSIEVRLRSVEVRLRSVVFRLRSVVARLRSMEVCLRRCCKQLNANKFANGRVLRVATVKKDLLFTLMFLSLEFAKIQPAVVHVDKRTAIVQMTSTS